MGSFLREMPKVETSLFDVLSDTKASDIAKKKAADDLDAKVDNILMRVESKDFLLSLLSRLPKRSLSRKAERLIVS